MTQRTFTVTGMSCGGCEDNVRSRLESIPAVERVEADHETDSVEVVTAETIPDEKLTAAIEDAGYQVEA